MAMTAIVSDEPQPASPVAMLHVSNLLTYASLLVGVGAIVAALWYGDRAVAGIGIALSVVLDTFDGRFARRFVRSAVEREFGVQLDSLADAINSGIVPVVVLTALLRPGVVGSSGIWILAAFVHLLAVVTRLGFYNLTHEDGDYFIGLPAPVAALTVATMLLWPVALVPAACLLLVCGVAMLSPMRIGRPRGFGLALFVLWPAVVIVTHIVAMARQ
jgi:CDP-diacylglycerol--serine O-phosphatidyltransferase